jgi:predicted HNH restriction endonuclease
VGRLHSREWRRLWTIVIARQAGRCQTCGRRENHPEGGPLEAHHKDGYKNLGREQPKDLVALCPACHDAAHGRADDDPV